MYPFNARKEYVSGCLLRQGNRAETLIAQSADILYQGTDSPSVVQVAQERGLYAFGQDSDMLKCGPSSHLSANVAN